MTIIMPESQCQNHQRLCFYGTNKPFSDVRYFGGQKTRPMKEEESGKRGRVTRVRKQIHLSSSRHHVIVQIAKCICPSYKMYLHELQNVFVKRYFLNGVT